MRPPSLPGRILGRPDTDLPGVGDARLHDRILQQVTGQGHIILAILLRRKHHLVLEGLQGWQCVLRYKV